MYKLNEHDKVLVEGALMMARALCDFFAQNYRGGKLNVSAQGDVNGSPFKTIKCDPVDVVKAASRLGYFGMLSFIHEVPDALDVDYEFGKPNSKGEHPAVFKGFKEPPVSRGNKAFEVLCQLLGREDHDED